MANIEEMKARIAQANKSVNELNTQSTRNQSAKEVLTKQFEELCLEYNTKYGVSLTADSLVMEKASVLEEKVKEVEVVENVIKLINEGNIAGAKRALGIEIESPIPEVVAPVVIEPEIVQPVQAVSSIIPPVVQQSVPPVAPVAPTQPVQQFTPPVVPAQPVQPVIPAQQFVPPVAPTQPVQQFVPPVAPVVPMPSQAIPSSVSQESNIAPPTAVENVAPAPTLSDVTEEVTTSPQKVTATSFAGIIGGTAFEPGKM